MTGSPDAQKAQGVPKSHAEHVVLEHPAVIFQAHKQLAFPGALGQGVPHHLAKGQHVKQQEAQQQRPGKEIALPRPFHTPHSANVISMVETVRSTSSSRDSSGTLKVPGFVQVVDVQIQIGVHLGAVDAV